MLLSPLSSGKGPKKAGKGSCWAIEEKSCIPHDKTLALCQLDQPGADGYVVVIRGLNNVCTLLRPVAPQPAPCSLQAPAGLVCNMTVKGNRRVVHMTNSAGNKLEQVLTKAYDSVSVQDVVLRIRLPKQKHVRRDFFRVSGSGWSCRDELPRCRGLPGGTSGIGMAQVIRRARKWIPHARKCAGEWPSIINSG